MGDQIFSTKTAIESRAESKNDESVRRELLDIRHALAESTIVAFTDQTGRISYVNDKFCKISKYTREELIGQDHRIINSGHHTKEFFKSLWTTIANGEIWRGDICNRAKDGSLYWVATTLIPFLNENGKPYQYVAIRHDITDQKSAELSLADKEWHLRAILESVPECIKLLDEKGRTLEMNRAGLEFIEADSIDEISGKSAKIFIVSEYQKRFIEQLGKVFKGESVDIEYEIDGLKGRRRWLESHLVPFRNSQGEIASALGITNDVTERKSTEAKLLEQKEMIEQTYDAIYSWRLDDGIIYWNQSAEKLYGYKLEEVAGKEVYEVLETEYETSFDDYFKQLKRDGFWEGEIRQKTKNGKKIFVESRQRVRESKNGETIVLESSRDITARKIANERIRQQASLLEKTRDAILVCDLNYKIIYWNRGAENLYGWQADEVLGKDISKVTFDGNVFEFEQAVKALKQSDEWQSEAINLNKQGREIIAVSRWTLVRNDLGQPDYVLIVNTNISDLKRSENQLLRAQRLESIGTLAGGIAHDLNNVLSPILMAVDMLSSDLNLPEDSEQWLSIIRENTTRGADLIKQVLTFAKGSSDGNREQVQISYLVKDLMSVWKKTFSPNIKIEYYIESQLPLVLAESTQIHQMLMNLAVNAKDAMKESGGVLKLSAQKVEIDENYAQMNPDSKPGQYISITVEDTGTGMSPETLERIWDPFFTTKEIGEGTGLGLSTTLSIVKSNGGFINAYSDLDIGTKFSVYLPTVLDVNEKEARNLQKARYPKGNGELILIVDDEENIRRLASATLEKYGYKTLLAADGTEALAIYSQHENIDLILTDMAMPFMDGAATVRAIRKINPDQKIIAASGLTSGKYTNIRGLKVNEFLAKPYTGEKLLTIIAAVLSGNQLTLKTD